MTRITYIVPVLNEQENIISTSEAIKASFKDSGIDEYEILFIDDGSSDDTYSLLCYLCEGEEDIKAIRLSRNFGHQAAVSAGMRYASGDLVAVIDGDLQDPPEVINSFLQYVGEGYDVVYGVRTKRKEGLHKRFAYHLFYRLLQRLSNIQIPLDSGDFCLLTRRAVMLMNEVPEVNRYVRGIRSYIGLRQIGVKYERHARYQGESKYTISKLLRLASDGIFNFSDRPIKLTIFLGFCVSSVSFITAVLFALWRLTDIRVMGHSAIEVPGYASIIFAISFLSGIQLLTLGVIGEYIARIFTESKGRPGYLIWETKNIQLKNF